MEWIGWKTISLAWRWIFQNYAQFFVVNMPSRVKHLCLTHQSVFLDKNDKKIFSPLNRIINCFWYKHLLPEYSHSMHDLITISDTWYLFLCINFFSRNPRKYLRLSNSYDLSGSFELPEGVRENWFYRLPNEFQWAQQKYDIISWINCVHISWSPEKEKATTENDNNL